MVRVNNGSKFKEHSIRERLRRLLVFVTAAAAFLCLLTMTTNSNKDDDYDITKNLWLLQQGEAIQEVPSNTTTIGKGAAEENGRRKSTRDLQGASPAGDATSATATGAGATVVKPLSCKDYPGSARFKKETTVDPPFWIALHGKHKDKLRWKIMRHGVYYEKGITLQFQKILKDQPAGIVLDVGMNIGWFSLLSRSLGHNVYSFEPNPMNIKRMCASLRLNNGWDTDGRQRIFHTALGSEAGNST